MSGAGDFEQDGTVPDGGADDLDALAGLLPFYVNGQLSSEARARVDAGLARMPELRAELAEVEALSALVKQAGAEWTGSVAAEGRPETQSETPSETEHQTRPDASSEPVAALSSARLQRLMARIAEQDAPVEATSGTSQPPPNMPPSQKASTLQTLPGEPLSQVLPFTQTSKHTPTQPGGAPQRLPFRQRLFRPPYSMALAAGLAAIAIVQAGWLMRSQPAEDEPYASLSGIGPPAPAAIVFSLRLKPETPWGDVAALLSSQNLRIVAGPRDGMIDVAPNAALTAPQADTLEQALHASPLVVFVGRGF